MASSAAKLIPSDPDKVMIIRRITPNILTCSVPFYRVQRIRIGGRGTIVKLKDSSLAVFSPVALTNNVKTQMQEQLGSTDVQYLAAMDQEHHIFLEQWHKEYPQAKIIAPETLPALREKQGYPNFPENYRLVKAEERKAAGGIKIDERFDEEFDVEYVPAHPNKELVFNHRPSKTLIEADLMFNLPATEQHSKVGDAHSGILTKIFIALNSTKGGNNVWQKRFLWYAMGAGDRPSMTESIRKINTFDFDRIIPCHGDVIETDGKGVFERIFGWFLEGSKSG